MSSLTARRRAYVAVQVTLTTADTPYRLLDLINTVLAGESGMASPPMVCPDACGHLILQTDSSSTGPILIGDGLISTSRYGYQIAKSAAQSYTSGNLNVIQLGSMYVQSHTMGDKLNVEVMTY